VRCIWSMALRPTLDEDYRAIINELELYGANPGRQATRHNALNKDRALDED